MKKLFAQIVKFGIVGFISFGIDYVTGLIVLNLVMALTSSSYFEMASLVGSVAGFTVSVIANYILSFKFVFERKEDLNKKVEFITFVVLSLIGMLLNSFLIWIVVGPIYRETYKRLFNKDAKIMAIHAGLECGLFLEKYPKLDMISFGPTLRDVHSPNERIEIATVGLWWSHLLELLKSIPAK